MDSNAEILKEAESGFQIDLSALVAQALRAKQEEEAAKYTEQDLRGVKRERAEAWREEIEQTPPERVLTWRVTPEQVARINAGKRDALDEFYFDNLTRLRFSAYRYMRNNPYLKAVVSYEDLLQQVYFDLRTGAVKLRPFDAAICRAVFHSFRYAAVGGDDEIFIYKTKGEGNVKGK